MEVFNYTEFRKELKSSPDKASKNEEVIIVSHGKNKNVV